MRSNLVPTPHTLRHRQGSSVLVALLVVAAMVMAPSAGAADPRQDEGSTSSRSAGRLTALDLRIDGTSSPLGLDDPRPSFS